MIAIVAPYERTEVTWAAIRLADLVLGCGQEVRLVPVGPTTASVHPFWNNRLWTASGDGLYLAAQGAQAVIQFQASSRVLGRTGLVADQAIQILVPGWHALRDLAEPRLRAYHRIVAPSRQTYTAILETAFRGRADQASRLSWAAFDYQSMIPRRRDGLLDRGRLSACVVASAGVIAGWGDDLLEIIRALLAAHPDLSIHLLSARSWPDQGRRLLRQLVLDWPDRFVAGRMGGIPTTAAVFHASDWVLLPGVRYDFGMFALRALACGCGVIALDVAPLNEVLSTGSAILAPCTITRDSYGAPTAIPAPALFYTTCVQAFGSEYPLRQIQCHQAGYVNSSRVFQQHWAKLLELDTDD